MPYRYETHVHCSLCSACAASTPAELVHAYHSAGYTGFVLTDHFIYGNTSVPSDLPWSERMERYYGAFLEARTAAMPLDFDVIFGLEHAYGDGKEVLVYGVELDFLLANADIPALSLDVLTERVHRAGGVVIQAHPYRDRYYIDMSVPPRADIVDGIEVYNAGNRPQENPPALRLAAGGDYILTSGGDVHSHLSEDIGAAGVVFDRRIKDSKDFADALRLRQHRLIIGGREASCTDPETMLALM